MANQYGISLAEVYKDAEAIKSARNKNALSKMDLEAKQKALADAPAKEAAALEQKNMLATTRKEASTGNEEAQRTLLAIDPEGGQKLISEIAKMDDRKRAKLKDNVEQIGQMSAYVLQAKDPAEQTRRYDLVYQNLPEEQRANMPQQFDPNFLQMSLSRASAVDKILENPKAIQVGGEDVVYQGGKEIERAKRPVKDGNSGEGGTGVDLKSADESLMYRQAAERMGGVFDEGGNLRALDPTVRDKIQSITTEATKIYQRGGVTRSEAVSQAYAKMDQVSDPQSNSKQIDLNNDPLGLL